MTHYEAGGEAQVARTNILEYNRMKAVEKLTSILQQKEDAAFEAQMLGMATSQFSQMDRSDRIRNYNFPNNRFTQTRQKLSLSRYFNQVEVQQELWEYMDKKEDEKLEKLFERFKREIAKKTEN